MTRLDKPRVLIADRNGHTASRLAQLLVKNSYSVVASVSSGEEAVTGSQWLRPDLVFMGVDLEGDVDGLEAAEEISITTPTKIVFLGDSQLRHSLDRQRAPEAIGFVKSTADDETLLSMADALARREMHSPSEASEWGTTFFGG